jgi:hypothetical protein
MEKWRRFFIGKRLSSLHIQSHYTVAGRCELHPKIVGPVEVGVGSCPTASLSTFLYLVNTKPEY